MIDTIINKINNAQNNADLYEAVQLINSYAAETDDAESVKHLRSKLKSKSQKLVKVKSIYPRTV
jgi:hypothetical protein